MSIVEALSKYHSDEGISTTAFTRMVFPYQSLTHGVLPCKIDFSEKLSTPCLQKMSDPASFNITCSLMQAKSLILRIDELQFFTGDDLKENPEYHQSVLAVQYQKRGAHYEFVISIDGEQWWSAYDHPDRLAQIFKFADYGEVFLFREHPPYYYEHAKHKSHHQNAQEWFSAAEAWWTGDVSV